MRGDPPVVSKPKPTRVKKAKCAKGPRPGSRKDLEVRLEALIRQIVWWRDGSQCVERFVDGGRCSGGIQWGHFTPRKQSRWLKLTIQSFCQCRNHNGLHDKGSQTMANAINHLLGPEWIQRHELERDAHRYPNDKVHVEDLKARLQVYEMLWEHRPTLYDTKELIARGYYGPPTG